MSFKRLRLVWRFYCLLKKKQMTLAHAHDRDTVPLMAILWPAEKEAVSHTVRAWKTRGNVELDGPKVLERVWVGYFLSHRTLKIPSSINKPCLLSRRFLFSPGNGERLVPWVQSRLLSPSCLPLRAHLHRDKDVWVRGRNKPLSGPKILGKTEQKKKALNFELWLTSTNFLLHQLHGLSF